MFPLNHITCMNWLDWLTFQKNIPTNIAKTFPEFMLCRKSKSTKQHAHWLDRESLPHGSLWRSNTLFGLLDFKGLCYTMHTQEVPTYKSLYQNNGLFGKTIDLIKNSTTYRSCNHSNPLVRPFKVVITPFIAIVGAHLAGQKYIYTTYYNVHPHLLVGGFNPSEKYARQIGSFPQGSG